MKLNLHLPVNSTSFGQTSTLILRTLFEEIKSGKRSDSDFSIFPLGQTDLRSQDVTEEFVSWLSSKVASCTGTHKRSTPTFKLWHLNGGLESMSEKQTLLSFYELDQPTEAELNSARNNNTLFSSNYSVTNFKNSGADCSFMPLAFDDFNFNNTGKKYFSDDRIVFSLCGKFEKRKNHEKVIKAWVKKFGGDRRFFLHCAVFNPFLTPEQNDSSIMKALGGAKPFNVNFFQFFEKNSAYNEYLNSSNIILGLSGGEGWGLPEFTSTCLGKHSVIMNAHSYTDWANNNNSSMIEPSSKVEAYDGVFFHKGAMFNQGNIFDFNEDAFVSACEDAVTRVNINRVNVEGVKLKETFSKEKLLENIIKYATS